MVRAGRKLIPEHPRVCGENIFDGVAPVGVEGTSPRMRGKHSYRHFPGAPARNIPAYAGKTHRKAERSSAKQEHPRVCGENFFFLK